MAGISDKPGSRNTVIFILPYKFQRKRLEDMKCSMVKKNIVFSKAIDCTVTHVVTEFESLEQVEHQMVKDGLQLPEEAHVVHTKWLVECLKASHIVTVSESHTLKTVKPSSCDVDENKVCPDSPEWACQRGTRLEHFNHKLTDALEVLQLHAEFRDASQDYSRALAFRRASCVFKSLPFTVQTPSQLDGLKDVGGHVRRVVTEILYNNSSSEVEEILNSQWFHQMKTFTSIFGVGPATAKNWISRGWRTVEDVKQVGCPSGDWRMIWGLAFYDDLATPVSRHEAETFTSIVQDEAERILPGTVVSLTGGFRRGKHTGHDVDLLITHPKEGEEVGLLPRILSALARRNLVLIGHKEKNSYRPDVLYQDHKTKFRGQLDHFEKWLGICTFPKSFQEPHTAIPSGTKADQPLFVEAEGASQSDKEAAEQCQDSSLSHQTFCSNEELTSGITGNQACVDFGDSFDEMFEPQFKKSKLGNTDEKLPSDIATSERNWLARRVDLIVSPYSQYYFALFGWTGSKHFNRDARLYAQKVLGMKLTSHGLYHMEQRKSLSASSEEDVFAHLKLPFRDSTDRNC